jgi:hypothetical protein
MIVNQDVELIPGTEIMNEEGTTKKSLVPQPSSHPEDPLNWSMRWKRKCVTLAIEIVLTMTSHGVGLSMPVCVDLRHWRSLNCSHVPVAWPGISFEQQ